MFFSLQHIIQLLLAYKYYILFPAAIVEGPIITVIAGFLASLGYLSFFIAYFVIVFGDLTGDSIYYAMGYWGREGFIKKWGYYIGINPERVIRLEKHFERHSGKTLLLGKISHGIGAVFLVAAGMARMPYSEFLWFNFLATIPKSLVLIVIGFYFGSAFLKINSYFEFTSAVFIGLAVIAAIIYAVRSLRKDEATYE